MGRESPSWWTLRQRPTYRGCRLRSLYELSFVLWFEATTGRVLGETLLYETLRVPYRVGRRGRVRTYVPDFFDTVGGRVYEVKPSSRVDGRVNRAKFEAARAAYGDAFVVVTERDFRVLSGREAHGVDGVGGVRVGRARRTR